MMREDHSSRPQAAVSLPPDRVALIDTVRALALFGVIVMNIISMTMLFKAGEVMAAAGPMDELVAVLDLVFLQGKARSCFALLFGIGFGVMLLRAEAQGRGFTGFYLRRMVLLLGFGLVNQVFLFWGDILVSYALVGMLLLPCRRLSDRALFVAGMLLVAGVPILHGLVEIALGAPLPSLNGGSVAGNDPARLAAAANIYLEAPYGPLIWQQNVAEKLLLWRDGTDYWVVYTLGVAGLLLLGLLVARRGMLFDVPRHRRLLVRIAWVALPTGLALSLLHATEPLGWAPAQPLAGLVTMSYAGLPLLAFGYVAVAALLLSGGAGHAERMLAPVGRMALTNYLASGAIGAFVFHGYGLGLLGRLGMVEMNLLAVAIFVALALASHAWLSFFHQGPLEWLWRCGSHGQWQPLRRRPPAGDAGARPPAGTVPG
jgi:uncharacterized protein